MSCWARCWGQVISALRDVGYDGPLSIENEDYTLGRRRDGAAGRRHPANRTATRRRPLRANPTIGTDLTYPPPASDA